jgi:hypothetical protein
MTKAQCNLVLCTAYSGLEWLKVCSHDVYIEIYAALFLSLRLIRDGDIHFETWSLNVSSCLLKHISKDTAATKK